MTAYQALSAIQSGDVSGVEDLIKEHGIVELDNSLRLMSGGGGSGLLHWVAELDPKEEHSPSLKLTEIIFKYLGTLEKDKIAIIIWKPDHNGGRPIHWAAQSGAIHILEKLLHKQIKELAVLSFEKSDEDDNMDTETDIHPINYLDDKNESPLFWACLAGKLDAVDYLIKNGANVNQISSDTGYTTLHVATVNKHKHIIGLLIDHKADITIKDKENKTALELAEDLGDEDLIAFFTPEEREKRLYIEKLERENTQLTLELKHEKASKEDLQVKLINVFRKLHSIEQSLIDKSKINESALAELERLGKINEILRKERQGLTEVSNDSEQKINILNEQVLEYKQKLHDSETTKNSYANSIARYEKEEILYQKQIEELKNTNNNLSQQIIQIKEEKVKTVPQVTEDISMPDSIENVPKSTLDVKMAMNVSKTNFEIEADRLQREYEIGLLKQLRETLTNLQTLTGLTNSALRDTTKQIDIVVSKRK